MNGRGRDGGGREDWRRGRRRPGRGGLNGGGGRDGWKGEGWRREKGIEEREEGRGGGQQERVRKGRMVEARKRRVSLSFHSL